MSEMRDQLSPVQVIRFVIDVELSRRASGGGFVFRAVGHSVAQVAAAVPGGAGVPGRTEY